MNMKEFYERGEGHDRDIAMLIALMAAAIFGALVSYIWVVSPIKADYERGMDCLRAKPIIFVKEPKDVLVSQ